MIRVVLRHVYDADGAIVGDFPPSELDALIDRLRSTEIYLSDHDDVCKLTDDPFLWTTTNESRPHTVFEILVD